MIIISSPFDLSIILMAKLRALIDYPEPSLHTAILIFPLGVFDLSEDRPFTMSTGHGD
jgi:hypothetical protein